MSRGCETEKNILILQSNREKRWQIKKEFFERFKIIDKVVQV